MPGDWFDQNQAIWQAPQGQPGAGMEQGAPPAAAPPTWMPGAKAGQKVTLLGFDSDKLLDPNSGSAAGSKYTPAAKAFAAGLGQDVGLSRGGLDNMVGYLKANGFQNATSDGKQKIDFGDGNGLIDVIRSDGQIVFQNTTGNPTWEGKGYKPDAGGRGMPTLGSIGQAPGDMQGYTPPPMPQAPSDGPLMPSPPPMGQPMPPMAPGPMAAMGAPAPYTPQTVQGPQAQALRIPGFANGVTNFEGGPAVVGEQGPELLNLPPGSDVLPFGAGGATPSIGGAATLGGGGALPGLGGAATLGSGGGLPTPADGGAVNFGGGAATMPQPVDGGAVNFGNGGGLPAIGGQPQPGPQTQQGGYNYNPMAGPQAYNPAALSGPAPITLGNINQPGAVNAGQVGPGQQVQPGQVQAGPQVNAERVQGQTVDLPGQIAAERVQGPQALQAQQLGPAQQQGNLSADQLQLDPSYQFRLNQSLGAVENSAAAKGMLHHPNTLAGIRDTAGQAASQEYAAANARNLGVQQQNFQNTATVAGANNAANAQAYGLTNQFQQQAALANQGAALEAGKFNVATGLQAGQFNAGQTQQAALANQQAGLSAGQFNSGQQQQANLANVANQFQGQQFNSQQGQQAALANQSANLNAGQFNANQNFQTQQANIGNQLAAYNAYQPLNQQNQQFNAAQQSAAAQNNFANQFSVNQANNAGQLGAFNANLGAELGRGQLALGQTQAANSYDLGQGNLALGNRSADQSYDLGLRNNALGNRQADQSYGLGLGNLGVSQGNLALQGQGQQYNQDANTFNTNYGIYRDNRDTAFNQDLARTQIGAGAAQNYGNQAGGLYSGQGNANGAAAINQGNAYAGAVGALGNIAGQAGQYYAGQPQQQAQWTGPGPAPWTVNG